MNQALQELSRCDDVGSLESALRAYCTGFGSVSHLDVMSMVGAEKRQAVCLLRLNSPEQERTLMARLGAIRIGEDLCVVVDMRLPD
jgi:hypothetical protein